MNEKKLFSVFGKRVRDLRKQKGWTQQELADAIDRTRDAVSNIERGLNGTHIKVAYLMAEAFGVPLVDLFDFGVSPSVRHDERAQLNKLVQLLAGHDVKTLQKMYTLATVMLDVETTPRPRRRKLM